MIVTTTPTIEGQSITRYCGVVAGEAILGANMFKDMFAGIRDLVGGRSATLQLKAPTCVMRWLLPRLMEWQALRPDVPVELTTTVQHGVDFRREGFDAAVVYGDAPNHGLHVRKLFDEQLTPVCAPSLLAGPVPLREVADLKRHMLLHPSRDEHDWRLWLQAAGAGSAGALLSGLGLPALAQIQQTHDLTGCTSRHGIQIGALGNRLVARQLPHRQGWLRLIIDAPDFASTLRAHRDERQVVT